MNILTTSGIQSGIYDYYLNNPDFNSNLFFTSTSSQLYYILIRTDNNDGKHKVIINGKFNGRSNGLNYDYRFNYDKYIKIDNQLSNLETVLVDELGTQKFSGFNSSKNYLLVGTTNILTTNINSGKLIVKPNGEIWVGDVYLIENLTYDYLVKTIFLDREDNTPWSMGDKVVFQNKTFVPITIYGNNLLAYFLLDKQGKLMWQSGQLTKEQHKDYTTYLVWLNDNVGTIDVYDYNNSNLISESGTAKYNILKNNGYYDCTSYGQSIQNNMYLTKGTYTIRLQGRHTDSQQTFIMLFNPSNSIEAVRVYNTYSSYDGFNYSVFNIPNDGNYNLWAFTNESALPNVHFYIQNITLVKGGENPKYYSANPTNVGYTGLSTYSFQVNNTCYKPYYYFNTNGIYEAIWCNANKNIVDTVEKEYLNINNKQYVYKINTTEQIKQNSGFELTEKQVYSLIKTPYVRTFEQGEFYKYNPNLFNTSPDNPQPFYYYNNPQTFSKVYDKGGDYWLYPINGWTGLIRKTDYISYAVKNLTYIHSLKVKNFSNVPVAIGVYNSTILPNNSKTHVIPANSDWVLINDLPINLYNYNTSALVMDIINAGQLIQLGFKDIKFEVGSTPTTFSKEVRLSSNELKTTSNEYIVENSSFDGWTGKQLSEKNIELVFTNPNKKSRKTNIKKDFYL